MELHRERSAHVYVYWKTIFKMLQPYTSIIITKITELTKSFEVFWVAPMNVFFIEFKENM